MVGHHWPCLLGAGACLSEWGLWGRELRQPRLQLPGAPGEVGGIHLTHSLARQTGPGLWLCVQMPGNLCQGCRLWCLREAQAPGQTSRTGPFPSSGLRDGWTEDSVEFKKEQCPKNKHNGGRDSGCRGWTGPEPMEPLRHAGSSLQVDCGGEAFFHLSKCKFPTERSWFQHRL